MSINQLTSIVLGSSLINQYNILTVLVIVMVIFGTLLIFGIRKSYKLKKDNERLTNLNTSTLTKDETYKDFTEGHMYNNKK